MDEFDLFAVKSKKANKTKLSVRFLGESMAWQSAFEINWPLHNSWKTEIEMFQALNHVDVNLKPLFLIKSGSYILMKS